MPKLKTAIVFSIVSFSFLFIFNIGKVHAANPVLDFSDLISGPKTGWEGSVTKGAAVSIWGNNFGSARGSNYVTVNGVQLTSDSDYAEWGVTANNARGLERITFYLKSSCSDGAGTISVSIGGIISNTLPFTVRPGNIYFISSLLGDNANNGKKSTNEGGGNGPWKSFRMIAPHHNSSIVAGDIIYIRSGAIYPGSDSDESPGMVVFRQDNHGTNEQIAAVGYPGEYPIIGDSSVSKVIYTVVYGGTLGADNWVFAKMIFNTNNTPISLGCANNWRLIGINTTNIHADAWSGMFYSDNGSNHKILGNYFYNNGGSKYTHDIYYKAWGNGYAGYCGPESYNIEVGWNEFNSEWFDPTIQASDRGYVSVAYSTDGNSLNPPVVRFYDSSIHDNLWINGPDAAIEVDSYSYGINIYNNLIVNTANHTAAIDGWNSRAVFLMEGLEHGLDAPSPIPANCDNIVHWYNNTIYNSGLGNGVVGFGNTNNQTQHFDLKNNVFYSSSGATYIGNLTPSQPGQAVASTNDIWYGSGGCPSQAGLTITGCINSDPKFISASNFHLQSNSPAKDAGLTITSVNHDYDSLLRPQGSGYDIGAFEYTSGGTPPDTTPPSPPTNVTVS